MHKIFTEGRKIFVSRPINHFPLAESAVRHLLMGGGIGVTPMIAFAHDCHARGVDFALQYSPRSRAEAAFVDELAQVPSADRVTVHISQEGTRADIEALLSGYRAGWHAFACGPEAYVTALTDAADRQGFPEESLHVEYFTVPELPDYENYDFVLKLARSGREFHVPAGRSATDVLAENGIAVDAKCADGICGVCKCGWIAGEVEHRDFVLSRKQRETAVMLCQSRAAKPGGIVAVDL